MKPTEKQTFKFQRSSFWFRLEDFDKSTLKQMVEVKTPQHCFDSYYVTHHFFGRNNWIWAIPIRSDRDGGGDLKSGFVLAQIGGRHILSVLGNDIA